MSTEALARAWMASPHWGGWRVGMVDIEGGVVVKLSDEPGKPYVWTLPGYYASPSGRPETPDLTHPGTLAYLLEDVRRAWGDETKTTYHHTLTYTDGEPADWGWDVEGCAPQCHDTEAAALMAALRAAPGAK